MKILIVSHNCFSSSSNMGKTLGYYFSSFERDQIAQLYLYAEHPDSDEICNNYYRFTDFDAIKSIFLRGRFGKKVNPTPLNANRVDSKREEKIYSFAKRKTAVKYLFRDLVWSLSSWNTRRLKRWIDDFSPDLVFFASGDSAFSYNIARKIAKKRSIPLVVSCVDDYYFYNNCRGSFLAGIRQKIFLKQVRRCMRYSSGIVCLTKQMADDYSKLFNKPTFFYRRYSGPLVKPNNKRDGIVYIGNLGLGRWENIVEIGKCLKELNVSESLNHIDVFSADNDSKIVNALNNAEGVVFKGKASPNEVQNILASSKYALHTESWEFIDRTKYSFSTKILETISSGVCLIAYGPGCISSILDLSSSGLAFVIDQKTVLKEKLESLLKRDLVSKTIVDRAAYSFAEGLLVEDESVFKEWLSNITKNYENNSN